MIFPLAGEALTISLVTSLHFLHTQADATTFCLEGHWSSLASTRSSISLNNSGSIVDHDSPPSSSSGEAKLISGWLAAVEIVPNDAVFVYDLNDLDNSRERHNAFLKDEEDDIVSKNNFSLFGVEKISFGEKKRLIEKKVRGMGDFVRIKKILEEKLMMVVNMKWRWG